MAEAFSNSGLVPRCRTRDSMRITGLSEVVLPGRALYRRPCSAGARGRGKSVASMQTSLLLWIIPATLLGAVLSALLASVLLLFRPKTRTLLLPSLVSFA